MYYMHMSIYEATPTSVRACMLIMGVHVFGWLHIYAQWYEHVLGYTYQVDPQTPLPEALPIKLQSSMWG